MSAVTVTSKGQVTLKKDLLQHLGLKPGEKIEIDKMPGGTLRVRAERVRTGKISDVFGALKRQGQRPVSIEEMNEAIEKGWAGQL